MAIQKAKFSIGDIVKHKHFEFRGVIYDVDFVVFISPITEQSKVLAFPPVHREDKLTQTTSLL